MVEERKLVSLKLTLPAGPYEEHEVIEPINVAMEGELEEKVLEYLVYSYTLVGPSAGELVTSESSISIPAREDIKFEKSSFPDALSAGEYTLSVECRVSKEKRDKLSRDEMRYLNNSMRSIRSDSKEFKVVAASSGATPPTDGPPTGLHVGHDAAELRLTPRGNVPIELQRTAGLRTEDMILWAVIKRNHDLFQQLSDYLDVEFLPLHGKSPFQGVDVYDDLRKNVNDWMIANMTTLWDVRSIKTKLVELYGVRPYSEKEFNEIVASHFSIGAPIDGKSTGYLKGIYELRALPGPDETELDGVIKERLTEPAMCELIWSYWHEEGMMVQTMQAISLRFQNKLLQAGKDPLASLNTSPLRPLSNLIWGYIQKEQERLSVRRRNYEYDHSYGIYLQGKAVSDFQPADSRKTFMGAFNRLLFLLSQFYRQKDDTTIVADAFPVKNALKDVHIVLSEGAHNQFGDLPWTARTEMFIEQYILGRPEMREFLGGRSMVPYTERWMENVDTMKRIQNWTDVSVQHFNILARAGEDVLLSIRHGDWNSATVTADNADNWAVAHRSMVQEYVHSYRAVTGIDLTDKDQVDEFPPSVHLRRRLEAQSARPA